MATSRGFSEAPVQWVAAVRQGLSIDVVDDVLAEGRLTAVELDRLALPRKTLAHRRTIGQLTAEQSDRRCGQGAYLVAPSDHSAGRSRAAGPAGHRYRRTRG